MRLILSRKGFDSASGGCPSPILPDGSLLSMPIPDRSSPVRYADLSRGGRNLGDLVERLPGCKQRPHYGAHLDPDLHPDWLPRAEGWHPSLGQRGIAQGHLTKQGVRPGDLLLRCRPSGRARCSEDGRSRVPVESDLGGVFRSGASL